MKLIDILVLELPKRGGWNDDAWMVVQDCDGQFKGVEKGFAAAMAPNGVWHRSGGDCVFIHTVPLADDYKTAMVTREEYEAALAASKVPVWSGEGLPPVGASCEWYDRNTKTWSPVKVVYSSEWVVVVSGADSNGDVVELGIEVFMDAERCKFRPIRTEAERKREETVNAIQQKLICRNEVAVDFYEYLAAGKIPGIRLTDDAGSQ